MPTPPVLFMTAQGEEQGLQALNCQLILLFVDDVLTELRPSVFLSP